MIAAPFGELLSVTTIMLLSYEPGNMFYELGRLEGIGEPSFVSFVVRGISFFSSTE